MSQDSSELTKPVDSPDAIVWQTAVWRSPDGMERIRRFNLRDSDGARNLRNMLLWAGHSGVVVVMVPRWVDAADAPALIQQYKAVI